MYTFPINNLNGSVELSKNDINKNKIRQKKIVDRTD